MGGGRGREDASTPSGRRNFIVCRCCWIGFPPDRSGVLLHDQANVLARGGVCLHCLSFLHSHRCQKPQSVFLFFNFLLEGSSVLVGGGPAVNWSPRRPQWDASSACGSPMAEERTSSCSHDNSDVFVPDFVSTLKS